MRRLRALGRKKLIALAVVVIALACCGLSSLLGNGAEDATPTPTRTPSPTPTPILPTGTPAQVVEVVDGDTIIVEIEGETYSVRYIGMDAPESTGEWLTNEATAANRGLVEGKTVYLETDTSETDVYDRLLRYVYLADGTFVNAALVRRGYARAVAYEPDTALQDVLTAAEEEARAEGRGLWQPTPVPTATPEPAPGGPVVRIVAVDKKAEYVDIQNEGDVAVDLTGWILRSERGEQDCPLGGILEPGATLRIWAMAEDADQGGFNCGYGSNIWNNSKSDPAVLLNPDKQEVSRY